MSKKKWEGRFADGGSMEISSGLGDGDVPGLIFVGLDGGHEDRAALWLTGAEAREVAARLTAEADTVEARVRST